MVIRFFSIEMHDTHVVLSKINRFPLNKTRNSSLYRNFSESPKTSQIPKSRCLTLKKVKILKNIHFFLEFCVDFKYLFRFC